MKHSVYYGGYTIYGTESIDTTYAWPVAIYNGIGSGDFPLPEDKKLREWDLTCEWSEKNDRDLPGWEAANDLIKKLRKIREAQKSERLVMVSDDTKTSALAFLTGIRTTEKELGVYEVSIKFTEDKPVSKKTTNVPYVERPGKVPIAETVVFNSATEVAQDAMRRLRHNTTADPSGFVNPDAKTSGPDQYEGFNYQWVGKDGKVQSTTNPNAAPLYTEVKVEKIPRRATFAETFPHVAAAFNAIDKAINDYRENVYLKGKDYTNKTK